MTATKSRLLRALLGAALVAAPLPGLRAQSLTVRANSGRLRVSSSRAQFLEGKTLARLHNGAPVVFAVQLTLLSGSKGTVLARAGGRFALSFDIWEERFAVARLAHPRKSVSHLTAPEAESWCLENLILTDAGLSPDAAFWIRLEMRAEEPEEGPATGEDAGVTLARLVELFSQPQREGETRSHVEAGPLRLRDLR